MRLTESEVIAGLSNPKTHVRDTLLNYFENQRTPPLELTHALIKVVDQFGWDDAFLWPHKIGNCRHDDQSLAWCLGEIDKIQTSTSTLKSPRSTLPFHLVSWIVGAPVELLQRYRERIANNQAFLKPQFRGPHTPLEIIDRRVEIATLDPQQAWERLTEHCLAVAEVKTFADANLPYAEELLGPIVLDGDNFRDRIIEVLADTTGNHQGAHEWTVGLMIQLAGRIRFEDSLTLLLSKFVLDRDWYNEQIAYAIQGIGTPTVCQAVVEYYHGKPWYVRNYLTEALENIHYEGAAETIFPLLANEPDDVLRVQLAAAMSAQLDDFAIVPASEVYRENPSDPERTVIIEHLYALACVADIDLPEKAAWGQRIESETLQIRDLESFSAAAIIQQRNHEKNKNRKLNTPLIQRPHYESSSAPKKLGRNAPCSCGSGKKYKKCCLRANKQSGI